jgi:hypothetical protein
MRCAGRLSGIGGAGFEIILPLFLIFGLAAGFILGQAAIDIWRLF